MPLRAVSDRILELRHAIMSCDAGYGAVTEELEYPLASPDRRLVSVVGQNFGFRSRTLEKRKQAPWRVGDRRL